MRFYKLMQWFFLNFTIMNVGFKNKIAIHKFLLEDERVWTGAKYIQGRWRWSDSGHSISSRYFSHLTSSHTSTRLCGEAFVHTASSSLFGSTVTEDLIAGWCTSDYLPMCEADMI